MLALRDLDADAMRQVLTPDAVGWLNVGDRTKSADEICATLLVERELLRSSILEVRHQTATDDGFVVQLLFGGRTNSDAEFRIPICIVGHARGGRIARYEEYTDETSLQPLRQEFYAHAATAANAGEAS